LSDYDCESNCQVGGDEKHTDYGNEPKKPKEDRDIHLPTVYESGGTDISHEQGDCRDVYDLKKFGIRDVKQD